MKKEFFTLKKRKPLFFLPVLVLLTLFLFKQSFYLFALEKNQKKPQLFTQNFDFKRKIYKSPFSLKSPLPQSKKRLLLPPFQIKSPTLKKHRHQDAFLTPLFPKLENQFVFLSFSKLLFLDPLPLTPSLPYLPQYLQTQKISFLSYLSAFPPKNFKKHFVSKKTPFFKSLPKLSDRMLLRSPEQIHSPTIQKDPLSFFPSSTSFTLQKQIKSFSSLLKLRDTHTKLLRSISSFAEKKELQCVQSFLHLPFVFSSPYEKQVSLQKKKRFLLAKRENMNSSFGLKPVFSFIERTTVSKEGKTFLTLLSSKTQPTLNHSHVLFPQKWNSLHSNQSVLKETTLPKIALKRAQRNFFSKLEPQKEFFSPIKKIPFPFFEFTTSSYGKADPFFSFSSTPDFLLFLGFAKEKKSLDFSQSYRCDKQVKISPLVAARKKALLPIIPKWQPETALLQERVPFSFSLQRLNTFDLKKSFFFTFKQNIFLLQTTLFSFSKKPLDFPQKSLSNFEDRKNQTLLTMHPSYDFSPPPPTLLTQKEGVESIDKTHKHIFHLSKLTCSKNPSFVFSKETLSLKEDEIENLKQQNFYSKQLTHAEIPLLPYLLENKPIPKKTLPFTKQHFLDIPKLNQFFALAKQQGFLPLTKKIMGHKNLPETQPFSRKPQEMLLTFSNPLFFEFPFLLSATKNLINTHKNAITSWKQRFDVLSFPSTAHVHAKVLHQIHIEDTFAQNLALSIPHPTELETLSLEIAFETSITYARNPRGKGYQFIIEMTPHKDFYHVSPEQNFIFIVDRSTTIKKHRYNVFKEAVIRSLTYLQPQDSFNILVVDSKITTMNPKPLPFNRHALQKAKQYLRSQTFRGFFSGYNPFDLLSQIKNHLDPQKENIVILITDGKRLQTIKTHKTELQQLMSQRNFSLFTACASRSNRLGMLDLISTFNGGEMMYSKTSAAFPRKFAILVKHIESCIAKDIHPFVTDEKEISFYPNQTASPAIYTDRPYLIYGTTQTLENFDLLLQGRMGNQWVNIKQHISFENATLANEASMRGCALQKAYSCYDYYLEKEDPFFLVEAEKILKPYGIESATR